MGWLLLMAVGWAQAIDVNGATVEGLDRMPGVGAVKARSLAEWRAAHGRCTELDELLLVPGFGPGTVRGLSGRAWCGSGEVPPLPEVAVHPVPPTYSLATVDINRAGREELLLLPGMTDARAARLVADREREGDYATCRDVTRIVGFGPATVAAWGERCVAR